MALVLLLMVGLWSIPFMSRLLDIGSAAAVAGEATEAIDQYYFRRWGLLIASLIITILAASLYVYIRRIEKEQAQSR